MTNVAYDKNIPYKIPLLIFGIIIILHVILEFSDTFDVSLLTRIAIVISPLAVSVSCFIISKMYGNSKVFGRSYLLLGIGLFSAFVGEIIFFHYVDTLLYEEYSILGEFFIFLSYPLMMSHLVINIRYFVDRLKLFQKILLVVIPVAITLGYSLVVTGASIEIDEDFYYYLIFVSASSIVLALAVVAFTLFRQTVLFSAWFILLIGITVGTIGDILYNYAYTLGIYSFSDFSNILWITSPLIMIYALYKHQKSI